MRRWPGPSPDLALAVFRAVAQLWIVRPHMRATLKITGTIVASLLLLAALYVASMGPAWGLMLHGCIAKPTFRAVYSPLSELEANCPGDLLWRYEDWCAKSIGEN